MHDDLVELKAVGVRLAIDDFGTGYSSLSYLRELPIDVLKMDKSFVDGIAASGQRLALAEGIVQLARTLQLDVIAEGIESELQRDLLVSMGCQYGQGYLLAMPMAAHQAETLARTGSRVPSLPNRPPAPGTTWLTLPAAPPTGPASCRPAARRGLARGRRLVSVTPRRPHMTAAPVRSPSSVRICATASAPWPAHFPFVPAASITIFRSGRKWLTINDLETLLIAVKSLKKVRRAQTWRMLCDDSCMVSTRTRTITRIPREESDIFNGGSRSLSERTALSPSPSRRQRSWASPRRWP